MAITISVGLLPESCSKMPRILYMEYAKARFMVHRKL